MIGVTFPKNAVIENIEIKVAAKQVPYITTKPIHNTQKIFKHYKNNSILIQLQLICNYELKSTLLGYGCDIEITKPITLRDSLKDEFQSIISNYE